MAPLRIENDALAVTVAPHYGARVTSLIDKATGRDWLYPGEESPETGEDAVYGAATAVGWDECFPTVSVWDAGATAWGRRLRDHGDLWGRPWSIEDRSPTKLAASVQQPGAFRFARTLFLRGRTLHARYSVTNTGEVPLPYLWAQHALLAVAPGERIDLPGGSAVSAAFLFRDGEHIPATTLAWPQAGGIDFPLDTVQPAAACFAGKFYVSGCERPLVSVGSAERGWLDIGWNETELGYLGLWLTYGGWHGVHHLAIEPTSAPADHLGQALERGQAVIVPPGARRNWSITLTCRLPDG
ncbi:MAG TPA: aldose 1-epimerase [Alphaproteobacteria bacterium]|nr:aldose 1-epimerase [Alphaproteobacteria bacterium]